MGFPLGGDGGYSNVAVNMMPPGGGDNPEDSDQNNSGTLTQKSVTLNFTIEGNDPGIRTAQLAWILMSLVRIPRVYPSPRYGFLYVHPRQPGASQRLA